MKQFDYDSLEDLALSLPESILYRKYSGDFDGELAEIERYERTHEVIPALKKRLDLERRIAEGMKKDYSLTDADMIKRISKEYPHFTAETLEKCIDSGHADHILKNGVRFFQNAAVSNILNCCGDILDAAEGRPVGKHTDSREENVRIMKERGERAFRFRVKISLVPEIPAGKEGKTIRIHIPYPRECQSQSEIKLISSSDPVRIDDALQRTAFIEAPAAHGKEYFVEFSYVNRAVYTRLDPEKVDKVQPDFYTGEQYPHIRFTPYLRALAKHITAGEENPLLRAKKIYEWITKNVAYSYMREYMCLDSIAENAALNMRGDCGVQAILFITLCRICGIPARWESGMCISKDSVGSHDWAQFYIAPYGWLYADTSYSGGLYRKGLYELSDFYFGSIDCFRLVTCSDFQKQFSPEKRFLRYDPYDNQIGEAEFDDCGLYPDSIDHARTLVSSEEIFTK